MFLTVNQVAENMLKHGMIQLESIKQLQSLLKPLGFKLDRSMDCKSIARYMTGELAGCSHNNCSMRVVNMSGVCLCNVDCVRDVNWQKAYELCRNSFIVFNDYIYEAL